MLSGRAAAVVLLFVVAEAALLFARSRRDDAPPPSVWAPQLLAGACLVSALWLAQTASSYIAIGIALMGAGAAHLSGYRGRWRERSVKQTEQ